MATFSSTNLRSVSFLHHEITPLTARDDDAEVTALLSSGLSPLAAMIIDRFAQHLKLGIEKYDELDEAYYDGDDEDEEDKDVVLGDYFAQLNTMRGWVLDYVETSMTTDPLAPSAVVVVPPRECGGDKNGNGDSRVQMLLELQQFRVERFLLDYAAFLGEDVEILRRGLRFQGADWEMRVTAWELAVRTMLQGADDSDSDSDDDDLDLQGEFEDLSKSSPSAITEDFHWAANELLCTYEELVALITTRAERVRLQHSSVDFLVARRNWPALAKKIAQDWSAAAGLSHLQEVFGTGEDVCAVLDRAQNLLSEELDFAVLPTTTQLGAWKISAEAETLATALVLKEEAALAERGDQSPNAFFDMVEAGQWMCEW